MKAVINRYYFEEKQTLGDFDLIDNGVSIFSCKTLELPWKDNKFQVSCIPEGVYSVVHRTSQKFKKHFHIKDVPNRSWILIHAGNYYTDILGCVLVGDSYKDLNNDGFRDVLNSKNTLNKILQLAPGGFELTIQNC